MNPNYPYEMRSVDFMKSKLFLESTVDDLEGMIQDQRLLMEKLTAECKLLTEKLEDTTTEHKYFILFVFYLFNLKI